MVSSHLQYTGNCPRSVNKDAKYAVRLVKGQALVTLTYTAPNGEQWLASTEDHAELVRLVNEIKMDVGGAPNGLFYINEHRQVIVPVGQEATYYLAAKEYDAPLRFEFEGNIISGEGVDWQGQPLAHGDTWRGPHAGIPYILEPGMADIRYESNPRPMVTRKVRLSSIVGREAASQIARRIGGTKGWQGGRFYINEWRQLFAPVTTDDNLEYRYIGLLEDDEPWFPKPAS